jgi:hypothetical protein
MASGEQTAETSAAEETTAAARCGSSQECSTDELCDVHETEQCQPKPDGLGDDCKTADDCAKTDATYCEAFSSHTCQVEACKELDGVCPGDLVCCEYSLLKRSLCIPPENLEAGDCPSSGTLIPRGEP